jgi:transposase
MEGRQRKSYPQEYKANAVQLAKDIGLTKAEKQLGLAHGLINSWRRKMESTGEVPAAKTESAEEELKRLRRENLELKKVNHILKSAAAIFTRDHLS